MTFSEATSPLCEKSFSIPAQQIYALVHRSTANDTNSANSKMDENNDPLDVNNSRFIIDCQEGERLAVYEKDAQWLFRNVDYFKNAFRQGTRKSADRVLSKRDWTLATAHRLISYLKLRMVSIPISDLAAIMDFVAATSQVLVGFSMHFPVALGNSDLRLGATLSACLIRRLHQENNQFTWKTRISGSIWEFLLRKGLLLFPESSGKLMFEQPKRKLNENELKILKGRMIALQTYQVLTPFGLETAVQGACKMMNMIYLKTC
jgi:hypothetical protein